METREVPEAFDLLAPDGSEIRLLVKLERGSMVHCRLPAGQVTRAIRHQTVEELWYCIAGNGEVWRRDEHQADTSPLRPGVSVSIPCGASFQFRALDEALELVIVTMPPWPGAQEAVAVPDHWPADVPTR